MGSSHEPRPRGQQPSPFDTVPGAATGQTDSGTASDGGTGTVPGPVLGPTAGAGPTSGVPFMGLYDAGPTPAPTSDGKPPAASGSDPHVTLFTGIPDNQSDAQDVAKDLNQDAGSYAGYDGSPIGTVNLPKDLQFPVMAAPDALAVLKYKNAGNDVNLVPERDAQGNLQYDANGNLKYDISYSKKADNDFSLFGEQYESPKDLGQKGAEAVLDPTTGQPPGKSDPITIDAHSGGGQTAFFTALELYEQGYTNINIVGFDMAMSPTERATLEKLGVEVTNTTTHFTEDGKTTTSPVAQLIQLAMGGALDKGYYDTNLEVQKSDVYSPDDPLLFNMHGFKDNEQTLEYMRQQNVEQSNNKPQKARPDLLSFDINQKEKSASVDIGGPKGLGAYVNLSEGQLDLNVLGHHVDVDQSVRNAAKTVTRAVDKAKELGHDAGEWVQDKVQAADAWVQDKAQTASNWVQDKTHSASNWVQDKTQAAGDWLQGTTAAVGNWLFGGQQSAGSKASAPVASGPLGGAKAGGGSSAAATGSKSSGSSKPVASKSPDGVGTVVTAPKDSGGTVSAASHGSAPRSVPAGKAADDVARATGTPTGGMGGSSRGGAATQIQPGSSSAPKTDSAPRPGKSGGTAAPTGASSPGKAADDVLPKASSGSSSKPAKSSGKALDDIAPKSSRAGSRGKEDRHRPG